MARPKGKRSYQMKSMLSSSAERAPTSEALNALATEYRTFKAANPAKAARVPESVKVQAKELYTGGATYSAIAMACGVAIGSARAWIEGSAVAKGKPGRKPGRPVEGTAAVVAKMGVAKRMGGWVTIRVEGRELDVRKGDFWDLLKGGIESGM